MLIAIAITRPIILICIRRPRDPYFVASYGFTRDCILTNNTSSLIHQRSNVCYNCSVQLLLLVWRGFREQCFCLWLPVIEFHISCKDSIVLLVLLMMSFYFCIVLFATFCTSFNVLYIFRRRYFKYKHRQQNSILRKEIIAHFHLITYVEIITVA